LVVLFQLDPLGSQVRVRLGQLAARDVVVVSRNADRGEDGTIATTIISSISVNPFTDFMYALLSLALTEV
jgi:hypothetical protein